MDNQNGNEMEQIQRGLEEFLEKEMDMTGKPGAALSENRGRHGREEELDIIGGSGRFGQPEDEGYEPPRRRPVRGEGYGEAEEDYQAPRRRPVRGEGYGEGEEDYQAPRRRLVRGEGYGEAEEDYQAPRRRPVRGEGYGEAEEDYQAPRRRPVRGEGYGEREEDYQAPRRRPVRGEGYGEREEDYEPPRRRPGRGEGYGEGEEDYEPPRRGPGRAEGYEEREEEDGGEPPKRKKRHQEEPQMAKKKTKTQNTPKPRKKRKKKHRLLKFLIAVGVIFALLGFGLHLLVGAVYSKMDYKEIASLAGTPMQEDGVVNILLIGNDSRENGEDGRSDAMILLSISSRTKKIYMTSLLRDMYVEIPGHDGNRLNAAYSFGGAELLMETIEKNFDISVNRYVLVNFEAFAGLVDAVGGIELELTGEEMEYVNGYLVEYNILTGRPQGTDNMDILPEGGLVHLNGPQALAYSRNRYLGTDFGRTDRQRKVLTAVIKKLPSALLGNAGGLMEGLLPNLTTNLTQNECFRLSLMAGKMLTYDIVSDSIPQPGTYRDVTIRKMAVLEVDFQENIRYLKEKLYGE